MFSNKKRNWLISHCVMPHPFKPVQPHQKMLSTGVIDGNNEEDRHHHPRGTCDDGAGCIAPCPKKRQKLTSSSSWTGNENHDKGSSNSRRHKKKQKIRHDIVNHSSKGEAQEQAPQHGVILTGIESSWTNRELIDLLTKEMKRKNLLHNQNYDQEEGDVHPIEYCNIDRSDKASQPKAYVGFRFADDAQNLLDMKMMNINNSNNDGRQATIKIWPWRNYQHEPGNTKGKKKVVGRRHLSLNQNSSFVDNLNDNYEEEVPIEEEKKTDGDNDNGNDNGNGKENNDHLHQSLADPGTSISFECHSSEKSDSSAESTNLVTNITTLYIRPTENITGPWFLSYLNGFMIEYKSCTGVDATLDATMIDEHTWAVRIVNPVAAEALCHMIGGYYGWSVVQEISPTTAAAAATPTTNQASNGTSTITANVDILESDNRSVRTNLLSMFLTPPNNNNNDKVSGNIEYESSWESSFEELQQYKKEHGHLSVPEYNPLDEWIQKQRMKLRKNRGLSSDQRRRLLDLGLSPSSKAGKEKGGGNKNVASETPEAVEKARRSDIDGSDDSKSEAVAEGKKADDSGSKSRSAEKMMTTTHLPDASSARLKQWEAKFEQLKDFKEKNGHCNVPSRNYSLYQWVRKQLRKMVHAECCLSPDQKQRLIDLGLEIESPASKICKKRKRNGDGDDDDKVAKARKRIALTSTKPPGHTDCNTEKITVMIGSSLPATNTNSSRAGEINIGGDQSFGTKESLVDPPASADSEEPRSRMDDRTIKTVRVVMTPINVNKNPADSDAPEFACRKQDKETISRPASVDQNGGTAALMVDGQMEVSLGDKKPDNETTQIQMDLIKKPKESDVLFPVRPSDVTLQHPGNNMYRRLLNANKGRYSTSPTNEERGRISRSIVASVRKQDGRFLEWDAKEQAWSDIGDTKANLRTHSALRGGNCMADDTCSKQSPLRLQVDAHQSPTTTDDADQRSKDLAGHHVATNATTPATLPGEGRQLEQEEDQRLVDQATSTEVELDLLRISLIDATKQYTQAKEKADQLEKENQILAHKERSARETLQSSGQEMVQIQTIAINATHGTEQAIQTTKTATQERDRATTQTASNAASLVQHNSGTERILEAQQKKMLVATREMEAAKSNTSETAKQLEIERDKLEKVHESWQEQHFQLEELKRQVGAVQGQLKKEQETRADVDHKFRVATKTLSSGAWKLSEARHERRILEQKIEDFLSSSKQGNNERLIEV